MVSASTIVQDFHVVAGVLLNLLLLYVIRRFTKPHFGAYKQLLTVFAAYDIFLTILHATVPPRVLIVGTTFGVVCTYESRIVTGIFCSCFTVPFALMIIHFLYRYWSARRPHLIPLFSNKKFIAVLTMLPILQFWIWYAMGMNIATGVESEPGKTRLIAETGRRFGVELKEGWIIMNHWEDEMFQLRPFLAIVGFDVFMMISFTVAATLGGLTYYQLRKHRADAVARQANTLHIKLLIAVCAQTFVPLIFVYIPYACVINFPFFKLPIFGMDDYCMTLAACFPAWDAVIMIALIKDYREGLIGMARKKKQTVQPASIWQTTTTMTAPSMASSAE